MVNGVANLLITAIALAGYSFFYFSLSVPFYASVFGMFLFLFVCFFFFLFFCLFFICLSFCQLVPKNKTKREKENKTIEAKKKRKKEGRVDTTEKERKVIRK